MRLIGPYMTRYATLGYASINELFKFVNLFYPGKLDLYALRLRQGKGTGSLSIFIIPLIMVYGLVIGKKIWCLLGHVGIATYTMHAKPFLRK